MEVLARPFLDPTLIPHEPQETPRALQLLQEFRETNPQTLGQYEEALMGMNDGVYITPEKALGLELPQVLAMRLGDGELQLGAGDSFHHVIFGDVVVEFDDDQHDIIETAIKGFNGEDFDKVFHEHDALLAVRDRGLDTFEPLAIAKYQDTAFLVTRRRPDVHTLDNDPWHISPSDTERYESEVVPSLHFMAQSIAYLHTRGIFHGDAQAKNIARSDTGELIVIDLEDATVSQNMTEFIHYFNGGDNIEKSLAYKDLTQAWYALIHPAPDVPNVFLVDEPYEVCMREFETRFLAPYFRILEQLVHPSAMPKLKLEELREAVYQCISRTSR